MNVVVHIGPYKTGSTSIQKSLYKGREALWEQGAFFYGKTFGEQTLSMLFRQRYRDLTPDMRLRFATLKQAHEWSEACWQKFEAEVRCRKPALSLISSEHFAGLSDPAPLIARLRKAFERITVIAYVREPVDLYCSSLQQSIRGDRGLRLAQLPSPLSYVYPAQRQIEAFTKLVGQENMIVRKFSSSNLLNQDVVEDFMATVSSLGLPLSVPSLRANDSVPGAVAAWLLTLNEAYDSGSAAPDRRAIIRRLQVTPEVQALPKLKLTDPYLATLINTNAHDACAWINEKFLDGQEALSLAPHDLSPGSCRLRAQEQLRDWLISYLTPQAIQTVSCAVMPLSPPLAVEKNKERHGKGGGKSLIGKPDMPLFDYRYIFVISYPRSGSTLLLSILNQTDDVCLRGENKATLYNLYRAISAVNDTAQRGKRGRQAQPDAPWFGAHEVKPTEFSNQLLNTFVSTVLTPPLGTRITGFKEIRHDYAFTGDEDFADYVAFLLKAFPDARIVFNTRDATSVRKSAWLKERPAAAVEKMVATCDHRFAAALQAHADRCFLVKYEEFTADPSRYEALFAFLGLPYAPEKIDQTLQKPLLHARPTKRTGE